MRLNNKMILPFIQFDTIDTIKQPLKACPFGIMIVCEMYSNSVRCIKGNLNIVKRYQLEIVSVLALSFYKFIFHVAQIGKTGFR